MAKPNPSTRRSSYVTGSAKVLLAGSAAVLGSATGWLASGTPVSAGWADTYCTFSNTATSIAQQSKYGMNLQNYYLYQEGYHWGGGCSNDNNVDDSPGETPTSTEFTSTGRGEGPDCSGLVHRAWGIKQSNNADFGSYAQKQYTHGDASGAFMSNTTAWHTASNVYADYWDAFANTGHIGLAYGSTGTGTDNIFEAKGEAYGVGVWNRNYRSSGAYVTSKRNNWAP